MSDSEEFIKASLASHQDPPALGDADKAAMLHAILARDTGSRRRPWLPLALAAAALLALGAGVANHLRNRESSNGAQQTAVLAGARDEFYILQADVETQSVVAQDFNRFRVSDTSVGDRLGRFTLAGVEAGAVLLQSEQGTQTDAVAAHNRDALDALDREIAGLRALQLQSALTPDLQARLEAIAGYGHPEAIALLAGRESSTAGSAGLLQWLNGDSRQSKILALRELADVQAPEAIPALRAAACDGDEALALLALEALSRQKKPAAVTALQQVAENAAAESARERAAATLQERLREVAAHE